MAALVAALLGMAIGHSGSPSATGQTTANTAYKPPPQAAPPDTATHATSQDTAAAPAAPPAVGSPTTTVPVAAGTGTVRRLVPRTQSKGPGTSSPFTITGGQWSIGWAFNCTAAPGGSAAFQIFVVPAGGAPATSAAVDQNTAKGQGVTKQSSPGAQTLNIKTDPGCIWVIDVTGM